jgi:prophage antirepressor-like protein
MSDMEQAKRLVVKMDRDQLEQFREWMFERWVYHEVLPEIRRTGSYTGRNPFDFPPEAA